MLPFALCFSTSQFWKTESTYYEHPIISYTDEVIIEFVTLSNNNYYISNIPTSNAAFKASGVNILQANVKSSVQKTDNIHSDIISISIAIPCLTSNIIDMKLAIGLYTQLNGNVKLKMSSPLVFGLQGSSIGGAIIDGDIVFHQKNPLDATSIPKSIYNDSLFVADSSYIMSEMANRNESLVFNGMMNVQYLCADEATIQMTLRVSPFQEVRYVPRIMESLKFAWIAYFSFMYPIYVILIGLMGVVFRNGVFNVKISSYAENIKKK